MPSAGENLGRGEQKAKEKRPLSSPDDSTDSDSDSASSGEDSSDSDASAVPDNDSANAGAGPAISFAPSRIKPRAEGTPTSNPYALQETEVHNGKIVDARASFASFEDVAPWLLASLAALTIRRPTAVQKACIPEMLAGNNVIGRSKTGSGKTVAFAVPILQKLFEDPMGVYAVVLTPTRELALQIYEQFNAISGRQTLRATLITGGSELRPQAIALAKKPHIVIATPGRLADHIKTSGDETIAGLRRTKVVVLDEADRLLAPGYGSMLPDVETCLGILPPSNIRQTCLFTATLTPEVLALKDLSREKGKSVSFCDVDADAGDEVSSSAVPSTLEQTYLQVPFTYREAYLHVLLSTPANAALSSIIVFCKRRKTADFLERLLRGLDHSVTALHSLLPQAERSANLARFRARAARVLVATDVASRGLDIPEVGLVVNYDVPRDPDDYVHRVGRTARAGREGRAVTMVGAGDVELFLAIEERVWGKEGGGKMGEYAEEGVNIETRVARDAVKEVGKMRTQVLVGIEEGRDSKGNRVRGKIRRLE